MRVFAWPRSPRKITSWPASRAFSSCGQDGVLVADHAVDERARPRRSGRGRWPRTSSLTGRDTHPLALELAERSGTGHAHDRLGGVVRAGRPAAARRPPYPRAGHSRRTLTMPGCSTQRSPRYVSGHGEAWRKRSRPQDQNAGADDADAPRPRTRAPRSRHPRPQGHFLVRFWRSAVGKKWVMAVTGIMLLGFVLAHMIGNLKVYLGKEHLNVYGEWLRTLGEPALPRTVAAVAHAHRADRRVRRSTSSPRTSSRG